MADNTDNIRWELSALHGFHCAQATDSDLCLECLSSSVCAVSSQCFLRYKLLISHRIPEESALILIYDKQELRSLLY